MPTIALRALDLAEADLVTLGLLTPDRQDLVVEAAFGAGAGALLAQRLPVADTVAAPVVAEHRPVAIGDGAAVGDPAQYGAELDPGPVLVLPLQGGDQVRGVLTLTRRRGRAGFSPAEVEMAAGYASYASVAIELADSRTAEKKVVLLEDRDRIARDLHDHVIQELFAIGLRLESVAGGLGPDNEAGQKISERVEDLDRTIRRIRTSIFALRGPLDLSADGLRQQILEIASDLTPALGFPAHVSFAGPVDIATECELADDITAVVREALTNAAKHAHATGVSVDISAGSNEIVVTVVDNGMGLGDPSRSSGLGNMRARAERHGGPDDRRGRSGWRDDADLEGPVQLTRRPPRRSISEAAAAARAAVPRPGQRTQVHLVRPVEQTHRTVPAPHGGQRGVVADRGAAVHLDGAVDGGQRGARHRDLGRRDQVLGRLVALGVDGVRGQVAQRAGLVDLDAGLGDLVLHHALLGQRLAEGDPVRASVRPSAPARARPRRGPACSGGCGRGRDGPGLRRTRRPPHRSRSLTGTRTSL